MGPVTQISADQLSVDLTSHRGRPRVRIEGTATREEYFFRLMSDDDVLLWISLDDWWEDCVFIRPQREVWSSPLEPIRASEVRDVKSWLWWLAEALMNSPRNPLYAARFRFEQTVCLDRALPISNRGGTPSDAHIQYYGESNRAFWDEHHAGDIDVLPGGLLPLRRLSDSDQGRLKWWKKKAREGELPPILVWYVEVLAKHVVLDGHVRLRAAVEEAVQVPIVRVWHERSVPPKGARERASLERGLTQMIAADPKSVPKANDLLREAYGEQVYAAQRGWPVPGGPSAWITGMRANLPALEALPDWVPEWLKRLEREG